MRMRMRMRLLVLRNANRGKHETQGLVRQTRSNPASSVPDSVSQREAAKHKEMGGEKKTQKLKMRETNQDAKEKVVDTVQIRGEEAS